LSSLLFKVELKTLSQAAGLGTNDSVDGRIIIGGSPENRLPDPLFVQFSLASLKCRIADVSE
ncbi:MAG TPA: hypothetical protein VK638_55930, partial [Edaphobacter sp.]|nr:hypothetical protein [Edaphobacter sp.]